jgi:hypothetical protein
MKKRPIIFSFCFFFALLILFCLKPGEVVHNSSGDATFFSLDIGNVTVHPRSDNTTSTVGPSNISTNTGSSTAGPSNISANTGLSNLTTNTGSGNNTGDTGIPYNTERDREFLRTTMAQTLIDHRNSCINQEFYNTRLDGKFTPQEHEYICEMVNAYKREHPETTLDRNIRGVYPDRRYRGVISHNFVVRVFLDDRNYNI